MTSPTHESTPARPAVAVLGTGIMGSGMARSAVRAGLPVRVWNRSRERAEPLAAAGATVCDSPGQAVTGADVVLTMLTDADAVAEVLDAAAEALGGGAVLAQTSTVGVAGTERLARRAAELGVAFVDAPVLGTRQPAEDGALVVLAAGPQEVRATCRPVFDAIGSRTVWQDEVGQGTRLKLACNDLVLTLVEGIAESLTLAGALGVDPRLVLEAVRGGAMDSPYVQLKGAAMLDDALDEPAFPLSGAAKDAGLIVDAARSAGVELAVAEAVRRRFEVAAAAGQGSADLAATYRAPRGLG